MRLSRTARHLGFAAVAGLALTAGTTRAAMEMDDSQLTLAVKPQSMQAAPANQVVDNDWHLLTRAGLWAMNLKGDVGIRDRKADVDVGFSDLAENMNFGLMPGIELSKGPFVIAFNGVFTQLENDVSVTTPGGANIGGDATFDVYIADVAVGYHVADIPIGDNGMSLGITPAVGLRYTYLGLEVNPKNFPSREGDQQFVDPYVGGRLALKISDSLTWRTDGSIGGFGVGSDFTWLAQTMLDWRFSKRFELNVGYRALYQDYEDGDFTWDMTAHGPWIGFSAYWF